MRVRITLAGMDESPQSLVERLISSGMTEAQIANALTLEGIVSVTQPTIHRIKHGASTSFEIGCALVRLAQGPSKSLKHGNVELSA